MTAISEGDAPGWKFLGVTKNGQWGKWVRPYDQTTNPKPIARRVQTQTQPVKPIAVVSDEDRDRAYREILDQLTLSAGDRTELNGRGISDIDIDEAGFKTWIAGTKLAGDFPAGLPGLSGQRLTARSGLLIPVWTATGLIAGLQTRPHDGGKTDRQGRKIPRYLWVSSKTAPIGDVQEIPLAVYRGTKSQIGLAEGTGAKPLITSKRSGYSVIGAAGGLWASSPDRLKQALKDLGAKAGDAITLFADAGSFKNRNIKQQYTNLYKLLKSWGLKLYVAGWGQFASKRKGDPIRGDFDEIAVSTQWRLFSWEKPSETEADQGIGFLWEEFQRCEDRDRYERLTGFTVNPKIKTTGRYIPLGSWEQYIEGGLFFVRAVPDSGKTFACMKPSIEFFLSQDKRVLTITTRRKLSEEQAGKIEGLTILNDGDEALSAKGIACCWESLHKLKGQKFDLIVMDEQRLGLSIFSTSSTLKKQRDLTRATAEELFSETIKNGGALVGLDADIDDRTIQYVASICGSEVEPIVHHHDQLPVARNVYMVGFHDHWNGVKVAGRTIVMGLYKAHVLRLCQQLQDGKPFDKLTDIPMLVSDSQSLIEDLAAVVEDTISQEVKTLLADLQKTIRKDYPDVREEEVRAILQITRKTNQDSSSIEYASNPTHGKGYSLSPAISPSGFVGISDEDDRIQTVYGIFHGVVGVNLARQALGRARRAKNWVIAYADSFALSDGRPSRQTDPDKVLADIQLNAPSEAGWQAIASMAAAKFGNRATLAISNYIAQCCDLESDLWVNNHIRFASEEWAISNYERAHFGELLIERLTREKHEILSAIDAFHLAGIECEDEASKWSKIDELLGTKAQVDDAREKRQEQQAIDLARYAIKSEMDATEAREILEDDRVIVQINGRDVSRPAVEDDRMEAKAVLARSNYPGLTAKPSEDDPSGLPQLVWEDQELAQEFFREYMVRDRNKTGEAYRHWAFKNPNTAKKIAQQEILDRIDDVVVRGRKSSAIEDQRFDRRPLIVADLLKGLDLDPGTVITHSDQTSEKIFKAWQKLSRRDKAALGISLKPGPSGRLNFFAQVLELVGFTVKREIKRKKSISILENDRFFDGLVEAIGRSKELRLAELLNPELKVARRDRERAAKAERIARKMDEAIALGATQATAAEPTPAVEPVAVEATAHQTDPKRSAELELAYAVLWRPTNDLDLQLEIVDQVGDLTQKLSLEKSLAPLWGWIWDGGDPEGIDNAPIDHPTKDFLRRQPTANYSHANAIRQAAATLSPQDKPISKADAMRRAEDLSNLWAAGAYDHAVAIVRAWVGRTPQIEDSILDALPGLKPFWDWCLGRDMPAVA
jgi:hypothetical protein